MPERPDNTVAVRSTGRPSSRRQRTAKGLTCTNCRQLKLKCDAKTTSPESCSRCRRTGRACVVDKTFQRQNNKDYLKSLEDEVHALRKQSSSASPASASLSNVIRVAPGLIGTSEQLGSDLAPQLSGLADARDAIRPGPDFIPFSISHGNRALAGQTLQGVHLQGELVLTLLESYYADYHNCFPILPDFNDFVSEYDNNQLLLWTMLAITTKDRPETYSSLVDPVRKLAADLYGPQSRSLKTMQALLLLCAWPFPFQRTHNDPSPMYCSLATNIGYQLGLHRPWSKGDFEENAREAVTASTIEMKTWYGCFIVNTCLAHRLGVPPTITPGHTILSVVTGSNSNVESCAFLLDLSLTYLAYQWVKTLGDDDTVNTGLHPRPGSLMILFENQVAAIRLRYQMPWSQWHKLTLCAIQLQIYSFVIRDRQSRAGSPEREIDASHDEIRGKAITILVDLAKHVSTVTTRVDNWPVFPRLHLGRAVAIGIYMAATTSDSPTRITILQACKRILRLLATYVQYPKDHTARVTKHFAAGIRTIEARGLDLFQAVETDDTKSPVRARMSANIPYQIIWWAKHSSRIIPEPEESANVPPDLSPQIAPAQQRDRTEQIQTVPELPANSFDQVDDISFFDSIGDVDFGFDLTDIHLDWQWMIDGGLQSHST